MGEIRDKTAKWLWSLAPSHMKEGNDTERDSYKLFSIWAKNTEVFKGYAYEVRKNRFPQWAKEEALNLLGKERGIEPIKGESLEDYRTRVVNALDWWKLAGTVKGIKTVFKLLGFEDVNISPADPGGERWAEFKVILQKTTIAQEDARKLPYAVGIINRLKPAHEKLAELTLRVNNTLKSTLYIGTVLKTGKHYTIGLRISPKVEPLNLYTARVVRIGKKTTIGVHKPQINTQPGTVYTGGTVRVARITTIYPA